MKKLTKILNWKVSSNALSYLETFLAGTLSAEASDSLAKGEYNYLFWYGITAGIMGLLAYQSYKKSMNNCK